MTVFAELLFDKISFFKKKLKQQNPKPPNLQRAALMPECCVCKHFRAGTREGASILQLLPPAAAGALHC